MERANQLGTGPCAETVAGAWARAWNAHDMHAAARLVAPDVDFVTVAGLWLRGKDEFLRHHQDIHRSHLRTSTWTTQGYDTRWLREDLALVHVEWTITGERDVDGTPRQPRSGVFTWILDCGDGVPLIAAAHNTNLGNVRPRLAREESQ